MALLTHFDVPFRWGTNRHAAEVEQDGIDDIISCITTIIYTPKGTRPEAPQFGTPDPTFGTPNERHTEGIRAAILRDEPRAEILMSRAEPDDLDELIVRIRLEV
jgi:phage baseplate assembly protein W